MSLKSILYFVKYPEPGKVKTRLAKSIGNEAAAAAYRSLAERGFQTLREIAASQLRTIVVFDPPEKIDEIKGWLPDATDYWSQKGSGLGERLAYAFQEAFRSEAHSAIALGSDTLELTKEVIEKAFNALQNYEVVIGPAKDGGYYLIGCKSMRRGLFENIPWSTDRVLKVTMDGLKEENISYYLLPQLEDLDE